MLYTMQYVITLCFILFIHLPLFGIEIDLNSSNLSILDKTSIFLDKNNTLTFDEIKNKNFISNNKVQLDFGLAPNTALWIRSVLSNTTNKILKPVIEYQSTEVEELFLYDADKIIKRGLYHIPKNSNEKSIHPHFDIQLKPYETKILYIKAHSKMRALSTKITLWNREDFIKQDYGLKMALQLFFGIMLILFIYNFMLWRFTKDNIYLFYILYLLGILSFEANYYGLYALYLFSPEITFFMEKAIISILGIMSIFFILFAKEFLKLKKFKKINTTLNALLYSIPITAILAYDNQFLDTNILLFYTMIAPFLIYSGFYALQHGVKEAKYYLIGWTPIMVSIVVIIFQFFAIFDIKNIFPYVLEFTFVSESLLFSIALAHRIEIAKEQKLIADRKLILFQSKEQERLKILVTKKTEALNVSLKEKEILYKELNHRIKNNFMMILSLIKLQIKRSTNPETIASLDITKNRIGSIANLYEILLLNNNSVEVDTALYLKGICNNIRINFNTEIDIKYDIQYNLETDNLVYVGLIVNELITNSLKYAFDLNQGEISIRIIKKEKKILLSVIDNGKGFKERRKNSLGLTIVEVLVEGQLQGKLEVHSNNGTKIFISWTEKE